MHARFHTAVSQHSRDIAQARGGAVPEAPFWTFDPRHLCELSFNSKPHTDASPTDMELWSSGRHMYSKTVLNRDLNYAGFLFGGNFLHCAQMTTARYLLAAGGPIRANDLQLEGLSLKFLSAVKAGETIRGYARFRPQMPGTPHTCCMMDVELLSAVVRDTGPVHLRPVATGQVQFGLSRTYQPMPAYSDLEAHVHAYHVAQPIFRKSSNRNYLRWTSELLSVLDLLACQAGSPLQEPGTSRSRIGTKKLEVRLAPRIHFSGRAIGVESEFRSTDRAGLGNVTLRVTERDSLTELILVTAQVVDFVTYTSAPKSDSVPAVAPKASPT